MGFIINRDSFENLTPPDYILKKASGDRVGVIPCLEKTYDRKFNEPDEIQFTTLLFQDNEKNELYENIEVMKYIEVPDIGMFLITSVSEESEGTEHAMKNVTAKSCEVTLGQKYLNEFYINTGETGAIDDVQFYNALDQPHSLLHLVINEKFPEWSFGHVDVGLDTMHRSFSVDSQDVYSFLMEDVATAFDCFFIFDSKNRIINVYKTENYGKDTNISVSYSNLLKNTELSCDVDNIKTALTVTGEDELTVREVAMGYETIYNFEYYNSLEFWSQDLYDAYNAWVELYNANVDDYTLLLQEYETYYDQINEMQVTRMPDVDDYLEWVNMSYEEATKDMEDNYSYNFLYEKKQAYEQKQAAYMKAGYGEPSNPQYVTLYEPVLNVLGWIEEVLGEKQTEINVVKAQQAIVGEQMTTIINLVSMQNNFTPEELKELSVFVREDTLSSDNYVVTDTMTPSEKYDMLNDMITYARKELAKIAIPQLSFTANILNLFAMPEFDIYSGEEDIISGNFDISGGFDIGNYIRVTLRDDFNIKAKLLSIHFDYNDKNNFTVTFGNIARKANNIFTDVTEALNTATSVATSVSFNSSYWSESAKQANTITNMIDEGLVAAGAVLTDGSSSEMIIDKRGIFINSNDYLDDGVTPNPFADDSIFLGGGRILFTDDDWMTVSEAVGRIEINGQSTFGVIARALLAGLIIGSNIYGGTINGSVIKIGGGEGSYTGGDGELYVYDSNDNLIGKWTKDGIEVKDGYIQSANYSYTSGNYSDSGIRIDLSDSPYIRTPKFALDTSGNAYFQGTINGGSININNQFIVDSAGNMTAKNGTITGTINANAGSFVSASIDGRLTMGANGSIGLWGSNLDACLIKNGSLGISNTLTSTSWAGMAYGKEVQSKIPGWGNAGLASCILWNGNQTGAGFHVINGAPGSNTTFTAMKFNSFQIWTQQSSTGARAWFDEEKFNEWNNASDRDLKQEIKAINGDKSKAFILQLNPISFRYNSIKPLDTSKTHFGFIAQDVKEITDNIFNIEDGMVGDKDSTGYYNLRSIEIIPHLVNVVQSQQKEIDSLKSEIAELKQLINERMCNN